MPSVGQSLTQTRIVRFVRHSPGSDRAEIAAALDLPRTTVTSAVANLLRTGDLVAVDAERGDPLRGRGRHLIRAAGLASAVGLLRWRGTRLRTEIFGYDAVRLAGDEVDSPEPGTGPDGLKEAVDRLVELAGGLPDHALVGVVISAPAPFLHGTGAPAEHAARHGLPRGFRITEPGDIDQYLSTLYDLPFFTENNANLGALGERSVTREDHGDFIYVKLDNDGLGSAVITNRRLVRGSRGFAGEIAHLQLDRNGALCHCGGRGCLWLRIRDLVASATTDADPETFDIEQLGRRSEAGDAGASRMLTDIGRALGGPLGQISTILDPDQLVVDSSIGPSIQHVLAGLRESLLVSSPPAIAQNLSTSPSTLGTRAEIHGALELPREHTRW